MQLVVLAVAYPTCCLRIVDIKRVMGCTWAVRWYSYSSSGIQIGAPSLVREVRAEFLYIFRKIFTYTSSVLRFTRNINWMDQMECILIGWTRWNALAHGRTLSIHLGRGVYCWTICTFASQISNLIFSLVIHPNLIPFELRCCLEFS